MAKLVDVIEVRMWGRRVGALALDKNSGFYAFEYDAGFLKTGIDLAPMALPIAKAAGPTTFTDLPTQTYKRLPAFIADSLPDDFGNALIDSYLATHGIAKGLITPLDRLAYMGRRAMGALEFKPVSGPDRGKFVAIEMKSLVESAKRVLSGEVNIDREGEASLANLFQVGTSAGGARAKAVIALKESTGEIRPGQFNVAEGYVHWLLKFDGVGADNELGSTSNYGRIEYAYHLMAKEAGINMEPCRLLEENGRAHFMTRRFDRGGNDRHHIQTLCAVSHLDYKQRATHDYSQYLMAIKELGLDEQALTEGFRRMAFNVLACNCGDHTKNFSFLLRRDEGWALAPAYDVTHAYNPNGEWTFQHLMSVNGKFTAIQRADLMAVAERFKVPYASKVLRSVLEAVDQWPHFARVAGVPAEVANGIQEDITAVVATFHGQPHRSHQAVHDEDAMRQEIEAPPSI